MKISEKQLLFLIGFAKATIKLNLNFTSSYGETYGEIKSKINEIIDQQSDKIVEVTDGNVSELEVND